MATNYVRDGKTVEISDHGGVSSGDVIRIGSLVGVAQSDGANGEVVSFSMAGVWRLPYDALGAVAIGDTLEFDPISRWFYKDGAPDPGDLSSAGVAMSDELADSNYVNVLINVTGSPIED